MRKFIAVIAIVVIIVLSIWIDISYFFVGGITEIVHGCQANPTSVSEIVWGLVRVGLSGITIVIGVVMSLGIAAWGWGTSKYYLKPKKRTTRTHQSAKQTNRQYRQMTSRDDNASTD